VPRVSVLIAAYNSADFLSATLESVVSQTYSDWEVVLADDASSDDTVAIAESFGERIRVLRRETNSGRPAVSRALALEHAQGELVAFLDADDMWLPEYLATMTTLFDESSSHMGNVGVVACDARLMLPDGRIAQRTYGDEAGFCDEVSIESLLRSNPIYTSALVPRRVIEQAGGLATELKGTDDHDLWLRIVELGYRVVFTRTPLAVYRLRATSLSADVGEMAVQAQAVYRRALARGRLTKRQRRIAARELRLQEAVERLERLDSARRSGRLPLADGLRAVPQLARVAAENADRVPSALRMLAKDRRPYAQALAEREPDPVARAGR